MTKKIVVVGAGIVGSSVAFRLAQAGHSVVVVEAGKVGKGTSGNSFSWLNSLDKPPFEYHRLNMMGIAEYSVLAAEIAAQDCIQLTGGLMWDVPAKGDGPARSFDPKSQDWNETPSTGPVGGDQGDVYVDTASLLSANSVLTEIEPSRQLGYRVETLSVDEAHRLEPDLVFAEGVEAVYRLPSEGWVEPVGLCHRLLTAASVRHGAAVLSGVRVASAAWSSEGGAELVLSDGQKLGADVVVNCTGPDAEIVATVLGGNLKINRTLGVSFVSPVIPTQLKHVVHASGVSLRPDAASRVMVRFGSTDRQVTEGELITPDDARAATAMQAASEILPALTNISAESVRIGIRPIPLDGFPVAGWDPTRPGLYHVVTHSGVTLGPVLGRLVAADVAGASAIELATFRPDRAA